MSEQDIVIKPAGGILETKPIPASQSAWLIITLDPENKNEIYKFVANKYEEYDNYIKVVGVSTVKTEDYIYSKFGEILKDKELYKQIMLPWQNILRIQNLIYKQK